MRILRTDANDAAAGRTSATDQDGDHIVSLVCLKKAIRPTPAPIQPQPQPYYTAAPQPLPTLPPVIPTQAPDVPQANGYSGY